MTRPPLNSPFFFFNDTATTEIYTLSLHDALPILAKISADVRPKGLRRIVPRLQQGACQHHGRERPGQARLRSEEHTPELQSQSNLVCRLLLEKKKKSTNSSPDK